MSPILPRGEQFEAVLNEENQAYGWFSLDELPEPLHPGMVAMLEAEPLNEMDVAGLISGGQLTSPQFFRNMYLWALRITGTGVTALQVQAVRLSLTRKLSH